MELFFFKLQFGLTCVFCVFGSQDPWGFADVISRPYAHREVVHRSRRGCLPVRRCGNPGKSSSRNSTGPWDIQVICPLGDPKISIFREIMDLLMELLIYLCLSIIKHLFPKPFHNKCFPHIKPFVFWGSWSGHRKFKVVLNGWCFPLDVAFNPGYVFFLSVFVWAGE